MLFKCYLGNRIGNVFQRYFLGFLQEFLQRLHTETMKYNGNIIFFISLKIHKIFFTRFFLNFLQRFFVKCSMNLLNVSPRISLRFTPGNGLQSLLRFFVDFHGIYFDGPLGFSSGIILKIFFSGLLPGIYQKNAAIFPR